MADGARFGFGNDVFVLSAKKVIFTPSQGVIDNSPDLFKPALETSNRQVELKTWVKVFMQFNNSFWNDNPNGFISEFLYEKVFISILRVPYCGDNKNDAVPQPRKRAFRSVRQP